VGSGDGVGEDVGWVGNVGFVDGEGDGEEVSAAAEGEEAAARAGAAAPVGEGEAAVEERGDVEGVAGPGEEGFALRDLPVGCAS